MTETSSNWRVDWGAVFAGAVVATAIGLILSAFGLGIGLAVNSPYEGEGISPGAFAVGAGAWTLLVQLLAFSIGGYVCARMRAPQVNMSEHESDVRDSLHGVVVWGTGVIAAGVMSFFLLSGVTAASENAEPGGVIASVTQAADAEVDQAAAVEGAVNPEASDETLAERRAELARKAGVISTFVTAASLLLGAVAAFFAAGIGGRHRDQNVQLKFFMIRGARVVAPADPVVRPPAA
jgi:hypothetical protein